MKMTGLKTIILIVITHAFKSRLDPDQVDSTVLRFGIKKKKKEVRQLSE